jgi:putative methionine-R-sulfoxide reductase with GAF domain
MRNSIVTPLKKLNHYLKQLEDGSIPETDLELPGNSEFNDIANSFNIRMDSLRKAVIFANNIKQKKYEEDFQAISEQDNLSSALLAMRESLKANELEVKQRTIIDSQQKWVSSGIAVIGEVLNKNYKNTQDFGYSIISTLVKYLEANQGGIFFINNDNPNDIHLECKASFAYDRRRYLQKRLELGEGYVGTCVLEKKSIFNKEIPKDYIVITSGLGDAPPKILMVVPLISDNEVFGSIEIASFKYLEEYQKEFVERACENIATTIAGVRIKEQTEKLYQATKEQSEKIAQDEEEMRQNLEEMQATQEEAHRREKHLRQQLDEAQAKIQELEGRL